MTNDKDISSEVKANNEEEYTPQLFSQDNEAQVEKELNEPGRDEHTEKLFHQDSNEEEDFEIPAFFKKTKVFNDKSYHYDQPKSSSETFPFSGDVG